VVAAPAKPPLPCRPIGGFGIGFAMSLPCRHGIHLLIKVHAALTPRSCGFKKNRRKLRQEMNMSAPTALPSAIEELSRAIDGVERAVLRQASRADLVTELALMRIDRNKLAEALDDALSRVKTLEAARITSGEKMDGAIAALRGLLAKEAKD
jgi:Domain of unknown function (DUF4164)